eukprot:c21659_g2_i1 orf=113-307(+)
MCRCSRRQRAIKVAHQQSGRSGGGHCLLSFIQMNGWHFLLSVLAFPISNIDSTLLTLSREANHP